MADAETPCSLGFWCFVFVCVLLYLYIFGRDDTPKPHTYGAGSVPMSERSLRRESAQVDKSQCCEQTQYVRTYTAGTSHRLPPSSSTTTQSYQGQAQEASSTYYDREQDDRFCRFRPVATSTSFPRSLAHIGAAHRIYWDMKIEARTGRTVCANLFMIVLRILHNNGYTLSSLWPYIESMRSFYKSDKLCTFGEEVNYSAAGYRYAYLYSYYIPHALLLRTVLSSCPELTHKLRTASSLNLVTIGGGAAPELIALMMVLEGHGKSRITFTNLDRCTEWINLLTYFIDHFSVRLRQFTTLENVLNFSFDFHDDLSPRAAWRLADADILMMVKCFSSVAFQCMSSLVNRTDWESLSEQKRKQLFLMHCHGSVTAKLVNIFKRLKKGSFFVFIDGKGSPHRNILDDAAEQAGLLSVYRKIFNQLETSDYDTAHTMLKNVGWASRDRHPLRFMNAEAEIFIKL